MNDSEISDLSVEIDVGDPCLKRSTSVRFILPFAWELVRKEPTDSENTSYFKPSTQNDWLYPAKIQGNSGVATPDDRVNYFTLETRQLLYERASWFILDSGKESEEGRKASNIPDEPAQTKASEVWLRLRMPRDNHTKDSYYEVAIRPPAIVLFEQEAYVEHRNRRDSSSALHNGLLILECFFPDAGKFKPTCADILNFNELFRYWTIPHSEFLANHHRLYAICKFLTAFQKENSKEDTSTLTEDDLEKSKSLYHAFIDTMQPEAERSRRSDLDNLEKTAEDLIKKVSQHFTARWTQLLPHKIPIKYENETLFRLVSQQSIEYANDPASGTIWSGIPDCRAFVVAQFVSPQAEQIAADVQSKATPTNQSQVDHTQPSDYWYTMLQVDPCGASIPWPNSQFGKSWCSQRTYQRWLHLGTAYGYTDYSAISLIPSINGAKPLDPSEQSADEYFASGTTANQTVYSFVAVKKRIDAFGDPPLSIHWRLHYFDTCLLLLYLRSGLFRFSAELHKISCSKKDQLTSGKDVKWQEDFSKLREEFLIFENLYQFPLLSCQTQHLEMYGLQKERLSICELYEEIDKEISGSDSYYSNQQQKSIAKNADRFNKIAYYGLSVTIGLAAADVFASEVSESYFPNANILVGLLITLATTLICLKLLKRPTAVR